MAVIGKIRQRSGLLIALIGIALAAFVLGDFFKGGNGRQTLIVGEVNGEEIPNREFSQKVERNLENVKSNSQTGTVSAAQTFSVKESTWSQLVQEILMGEEYENLGISVSSQELYDLFQGKDPHPWAKRNFVNEQGIYDPAIAQNQINNIDNMAPQMKQQWFEVERYIKSDRINTKYNSLIGNGYYVPKALAKVDYESKGTTADIDFIGLSYKDVKDDQVTLTDADYRKYYDAHKEDFFTKEEIREIDYVLFEIKPSIDDLKKTKEAINNVHDELKTIKDVASFVNAVSDTRYDSTWFAKGQLPARVEETMFNSEVGTIYGPFQENNQFHLVQLVDVAFRPDSLKASHILIAYKGARSADAATTRTKEEAKQIADSINKVASKRNFEDLAKKHSNGPTAEKGGDLGWFADGQMVTPFNNACVNGKKGDITVVETEFGFHVVYVTDKKEDSKKVRVAMINREITAGNKTYSDIYSQASSFTGENQTFEQFEAAVKEKGYNSKSSNSLKKMTNNVAGVENPRELIRWVFDEETQTGAVSPVFEVEGAYVVATLKKVNPEGYRAFDDVKESITALVKRDKKAEILIEKAEKALQSTKDINALAQKLNTKVENTTTLTFRSFNIPGFGREIKAIGQIFALEAGQVSAVIEGTTGIFIVKLNKYNKPSEITDFTTNQQTLVRSFNQKVQREVYPAIEEKADIVDNRILFY
ncbi:MAG: peptidylprolyl isomerase [Bacteroidales bacterium]|nr:peptidylprolyl isomerase [Bacteroidales bacterium]